MALFGNNKKESTSTTSVSTSNPTATESGLTCIIAKGTVITGKVITTENIRIDGTIKGELRCDKKVVMDAGGLVEGNIYAGESTIKGKVEGTVTVNNTLHLLDSSFIKGDIKAKKLHVEEGARYDGQCKIG
jgi:cytoskeletal protein CcmA (bactofilin family)